MTPIQFRSEDGRKGYTDAYNSLALTAREWLDEGRSFAEFVAWIETTVSLMGPPSWAEQS